jgi:hypothetical protein
MTTGHRITLAASLFQNQRGTIQVLTHSGIAGGLRGNGCYGKVYYEHVWIGQNEIGQK